MNPETLAKAALLAERVRYVLIATADARGWPHIAAAGRVTSWFLKYLSRRVSSRAEASFDATLT